MIINRVALSNWGQLVSNQLRVTGQTKVYLAAAILFESNKGFGLR